MTLYCAVPGCSSKSKTTDYTFHRFPRNVIYRARWILALKRPVRTLGSCARVCSRHFEERMFFDRKGFAKGLVQNAVPTLFLPPKQSTPLTVVQDNDADMEETETLLLDREPRSLLRNKKQSTPLPVVQENDSDMEETETLLLDREPRSLLRNKKQSTPLPVVQENDSDMEETETLLVDREPRSLLRNKKQSTPLPVVQENDADMEETETLLLDREPKSLLRNKLPKAAKTRPHVTKVSNKRIVRDEIIACRACLASEGRLYAISGSGLEDTLAALTGIGPLFGKLWPCHLCAFCVAKLSKCAAFRDSCQRSTKLLRTLTEKGPVTMSDIKTIDRQTHKLTNGLKQVKVYHFQTHSFLEILPLLNNQDDDSDVPDYTEVEYLESDGGAEYLEESNLIDKDETINEEPMNGDADTDFDVDDEDYTLENATDTSEGSVKLSKSSAKCRENNKNSRGNVKQYPTDIDSDTSEETIEMRKMVDIKRNMLHKYSEATQENPWTESIVHFENEFNCKIKLLSKEEQRQEVEARKSNNTSKYCCDLCGKGFNNESTIRSHLRCHNPSLPVECDVCQFRFPSRVKLMKHKLNHRAAITCNECGFISRNRCSAKRHNLMHKGTTYTCPYCQMVYNHQTSYYNHIRMRHPGEYEPCDLCGETFAAGRGMLMHKARMHGVGDHSNANLKCTACDVAFVNSEALQKHEELGAGVPHAALWPCAACGESTWSELALAAHAAEHQKNQHHCDKCNKTFSNAASFALHVRRKHMGWRTAAGPRRRPRTPGPPLPTGPCVCDKCGKLFGNYWLLQIHMNGHLEVKPFPCNQCPKAFTQQGSLKLHMRVHTGERPYQCEQCPRAFSRQGNFARHIKHVHALPRKYVKCHICGKTLGPASLVSHIRAVHMNLPYVRRKRNRKQVRKQPVLATET